MSTPSLSQSLPSPRLLVLNIFVNTFVNLFYINNLWRNRHIYWVESLFTAQRVCVARTMLWQDARLSVCLSVTRRYSVETALTNPYPQFQGHAILWRWISQKRYEIHTLLQQNSNRDLGPTQQCHFEWSWATLNDLAKIFNDTKRRAVSLRQLSFL